MGSFNKVIVMGNLTRDPEHKALPSGTSVTEMGLAVNEKFRNRNDELVETTCFVDVNAWGRQADICAEYLRKGSCVLIDGCLQQDRWEAEDGQKRSRIRVRALRVHFVARTGNGNASETAPADADSGDAAPF
ncbi:MAG: single-stranded DNA-binding protein [Lentisphaerae bacterium]|nr:single-stranded DNA-binding protein [Lentisphaerota bacterium]